MKKISKFLLFLLAFSPAFAFAGPFDPPSTDISVLVLNQIFGGLLQGGQNAFGESIKTFNSVILSLGGILAAYTILAGTLGTAHDGEMLGKKFSSVWIPIRYSLGTALVLPVIPGGYCVMQQIVMWLILQGVGLADIVWNSYIGAPIGALTAKMSVSNKQHILQFAEQVALAQGCTYAAAGVLNTSSGVVDKVLHAVAGGYNYKVLIEDDNKQYWYGDQALSAKLLRGKNNCGEATLPGIVVQDTAAYYGTVSGAVGAAPAENSGKLGAIDVAFQAPSTEPIYQAHEKAGKTLIETLDKVASTAATNKTPIPYTSVVSAAEAYVKSVETASNNYINGAGDSLAKLKEQSAKQGWFLAGAWYTRLTMLNAQIQDSINVSPSASSKTSLNSIVGWLDSVNPAIEIVQGEILAKTGHEATGKSSETDEDKAKTSTSSNGSMFAKITASVAKSFTGIDMKELQNNSKPPVVILQEAGSTLIDWWEGLMGALLVASGIALFTGGAATPIFLTIIGFIAAPVAALVGIGFTLGYMLPNLPFLMWIGVILGWLIMVIEAIIAAPLWAIMHLHPNGDDLTGKGANGYMLVLGLTLRPVLTIFGLIAALAVTDLMGEFVNKVFFSVFQIGNPSGFKALLITLFAFSVYTMAQFSLFKKTFALMHVIPDQLLRWIGGGGEQLGQYAGSIADGSGKAQGAIVAASAFAGEKAVGSLNNAVSQAKQMKDNKRHRKIENDRQDNQIDGKFGAGAAEKANTAITNGAKNGGGIREIGSKMGWRNVDKDKHDKDAYTSGLERSAAIGGQDGVDDYQSAMEESSANGFADHGGNMEEASKIIASQVEQKHIASQADNFGNNGLAFMNKIAKTDKNGKETGSFDTKRAGAALGLMKEGRDALGAMGLSNVLDTAANMPNRTEARKFVQNAVADAKFAKFNKKNGDASRLEDLANGGDNNSGNNSGNSGNDDDDNNNDSPPAPPLPGSNNQDTSGHSLSQKIASVNAAQTTSTTNVGDPPEAP